MVWRGKEYLVEDPETAEILAAAEACELTIKQPGIVINMPFFVWDGGKR